MLVMLKGDWPGSFRRVVRDENGNEEKVLTFPKGEPVEVDDDEFSWILDDMGKALVYVERDDEGRIKVIDEKEAYPDADKERSAKVKERREAAVNQKRPDQIERERAATLIAGIREEQERKRVEAVERTKAEQAKAAEARERDKLKPDIAPEPEESPVDGLNVPEAVERIRHMRKAENLHKIIETDPRAGVKAAAEKRLAELEG